MDAKFWRRTSTGKVKCTLCPHRCLISEGKHGVCGVRCNQGGVLLSRILPYCISIALDPIEKKPLYHFYPASQIVSVGTLGCNFSCRFCQNNSLSQPSAYSFEQLRRIAPVELLELANRYRYAGNIGVAYTYNEPSIWYEFILEAAPLIHDGGLKNVCVTNGFINKAPLKKLLPYIDAFNLDIKSIDESFYKKYCGGSLKNVLDSAILIAKKSMLEVTNLLIPTLNDSDEQIEKLVSWIASNLGSDTPLHFSAYYPSYKMNLPPTPPERVLHALEIASEKLHYVYAGNIRSTAGSDTFCPNCHTRLIRRVGYMVESNLTENRCPHCNGKLNIVI